MKIRHSFNILPTSAIFFSLNIVPTRLCHSLSKYCPPAWFFSFKILPTSAIFSLWNYCLPVCVILFQNTAYLPNFFLSNYCLPQRLFSLLKYCLPAWFFRPRGRHFWIHHGQCAKEATARPNVISGNHSSSGLESGGRKKKKKKKLSDSLFFGKSAEWLKFSVVSEGSAVIKKHGGTFHLEDSGSSGDLPLDRAAMNTRVSLKRARTDLIYWICRKAGTLYKAVQNSMLYMRWQKVT